MTGDRSGLFQDRVAAVMTRAAEIGLTSDKRTQIVGRLSDVLIDRAKTFTGLRSDDELIEFALASLVIEAEFVRAFLALKGTVDPDLDLEF